MKAIFTKFLPCTNNRGSRIKAYDSDRNSVTLSWAHELNSEQNHRRAAESLQRKMRWGGYLIQGSHKDVDVFVFAPGWHSCASAANAIADTIYPLSSPARAVAPTATWSEIIERELGIVPLNL